MLVDLKIEFGRLAGGENQGQLVIADVIDNDSWRIWPQAREELMLDKQLYRNLETVDEPALQMVKQAYERVADFVGTFPVMRSGMVAVVADSASQVERANEIVAALGQLGVPTVRHVANAASTPGFVLQLMQQLEASFARLVVIPVGENDLLRSMVEAASSAPVVDGRDEIGRVVMQCAKLFGFEDTVLFGRTLLIQANARSAVLHADASLQQPPPMSPKAALG
jgi:phosphoribosylaminoimidazole carboxylase/phosphoribosylaminoimidazole-succinocarboxamide synthase